MERNVWANFPAGEIPEKIIYWVDRWEELIENFTDNSYGLNLLTPHTLLHAVSDEIANYRLRNKEMRRVFKAEFGRLLKHDPVIKTALSVEFAALQRNLESVDLGYLMELSARALEFFTEGSYFEASHERLMQVLLAAGWNASDDTEIGRLSNALIVEFLLRGYHLKTIKNMAKSLFSQLQMLGGEQPYTEFPHDVDWRSFERGDNLYLDGYRSAILRIIDNLTVPSRLLALRKYFDRKPQTGTVIFPVLWLKTISERQLGPVRIYSPAARRLIQYHRQGQNPKDEDAELFHRPTTDKPVNIAVTL